MDHTSYGLIQLRSPRPSLGHLMDDAVHIVHHLRIQGLLGHVKFKQGTTPSVHKEADHSILWVDSSGKLYLEQPDGTDIEITHQSGLDITEIYNSAGMLKIQPDVQGNVELFGDTDKASVWLQLSDLKEATYNDYPIRRLWIDSGYRASEVYLFCRKYKNWAFPTKGHDSLEKPIKATRIDVNYKGKVIKNGLQLWHE